MDWNLPNQLTVGRVVLSGVFFVLLGFSAPGTAVGVWLLNAAFVIYIIAGITDVLDGYFARKWNMCSAFGRIVDPFVDKVLAVGAFAMLAGRNFTAPADSIVHSVPHVLTGGMASCVQAWMVVAIMAREFIVSAMRGYSESRGVAFAATYAGKLKMFLQTLAICTVLFQLANVQGPLWALWVKIVMVWLAVIATVLSGFIYLRRARKLMGAIHERP